MAPQPALSASTVTSPKLPPAPHNDAARLPLGTAGWTSYAKGKGPGHRPGDLWVGRLPDGDAIGIADSRHVLVVGGTRGGKGTTIIVPNLLEWPGSVVVLDPKGENAMVTARRRGRGSAYARGMGQKVWLLDPFGEVRTPDDDFGDVRVGFNPLDAVLSAGREAVGEAGRIADALIVSEMSSDPFWEESARALLKGIILHVASHNDYADARNLGTVRRLIAEGKAALRRMIAMNDEDGRAPSGHALLFEEMSRNPAYGGVVSGAGEWFGQLERKGERTFVSVMQVVRTNTDFIEDAAMQDCLAASGHSLRDLKTAPKGASLYLCLPQRHMETHFRWLRMMVTLIVSDMERAQSAPATGHPLLMVLDEFAALRRMRVIENAAAQLAGFGVRMMFVVQTLAQLKDVYRDNWETLVANAGTRIFFCNDDQFTREYASRLVGETETIREGRSQNRTGGSTRSVSDGTSHSNSAGGTPLRGTVNTSLGSSRSVSSGESRSHSDGLSESVQKRPLITPDEIGRVFGNPRTPAALVLVTGQQPLRVRRCEYFREKRFAGLYDWHRDHARPPTLKARADEGGQAARAMREAACAALLAEREIYARAQREAGARAAAEAAAAAEQRKQDAEKARIDAIVRQGRAGLEALRLADERRRRVWARVLVAALPIVLAGGWYALKAAVDWLL